MLSAPTVFTDDHGYSLPKVLGIITASGEVAVYVPQHLWRVAGEHRDPNQVLVIMTGAQLARLKEKFRAQSTELLTIQQEFGVPVFLKE